MNQYAVFIIDMGNNPVPKNPSQIPDKSEEKLPALRPLKDGYVGTVPNQNVPSYNDQAYRSPSLAKLQLRKIKKDYFVF